MLLKMEHLFRKSKCSFFHNIFKYINIIFQRCQEALSLSKGLNDHSEIDKTKILMTKGNLMKVVCIAECSTGACCNTFDLH